MEIKVYEQDSINSGKKDNDVAKNNLHFLTTDLLQFLTNDKNNEFYDCISFDLIKKQKFMIKNLCRTMGLNDFKDIENFKGSPGDFKREELKIRKYFFENQPCNFERFDDRLLKTNFNGTNKNKISKYINLLNLLQSKDFDYNMRNNIDFYKYITYHSYLEFVDKKLTKELSEKYSFVDKITCQMQDHTEYKVINDNIESNLQDEEYEDDVHDDYNEDDEYYESGDEMV